MTKLSLTNFEISEIEKQIDDEIMDCERIIFNFADMKHIAAFAMAKTIELFDEKLDDTLTLDEAAETFQNLLSMVNEDKYKPLIDFLGKIGGD